MDMRAGPASDPSLPLTASLRQEARWRELAANSNGSNPFFHPSLLIPALEHLDAARTTRVIEAWDGETLIGLMPVIPLAHHSRYPVRNCGNWVHDQCFYGSPLLRVGAEVAAWGQILEQLDNAPWAGNFLHMDCVDGAGSAANALRTCCRQDRRAITVIAAHERALLQSGLSADEYWQTHVRAKKRKEIRRLIKRLEEMGSITHRRLRDGGNVQGWITDFLALERSGWKGAEGTALDSSAQGRAYFHEALTRAHKDGLLDILRIDIEGAPIAMLVNLYAGRGAYSYKIAFDERYSRFSPGVLIEIDNLHAMLGAPELDWMDSCAAANHPMIDGLWAERRSIHQYRVALNGGGLRQLKRSAVFHATGTMERTIRIFRGKKS